MGGGLLERGGDSRGAEMRKVSVLGASGPSNLHANRLPDDVELWAMNMCHRFLERPAQRWFQMHHRMHNAESGHPPGHFGRPLDHEKWLADCDIPVFMQEKDPAIPMSVRYPLEAVAARVGGYLTSTAAYMIALAIYEWVDEISLLGIYLQTGTEYEKQRPCVEYLLGVAKGFGIKVVLPDDCRLTKAPLYAYSEFQDPVLELESVEVI
jgi:hypothetical protein